MNIDVDHAHAGDHIADLHRRARTRRLTRIPARPRGDGRRRGARAALGYRMVVLGWRLLDPATETGSLRRP